MVFYMTRSREKSREGRLERAVWLETKLARDREPEEAPCPYWNYYRVNYDPSKFTC